MNDEKAQSVKDLLTLYKAIFLELPVAGSKLGLGIARDNNELEQAAWKTYDTWVRLATYSTNRLFTNPFLGASLGRSLPGFLQLQWLTNSIAGAFFAGLLSAVGLPTSSEVKAVRNELQGLRREFHNLVVTLPNRTKEELEAREEEVIRAFDARFDAWREKPAA